MSDEELEIRTAEQRKILWAVLALNVLLAIAFLIAGLSADSSALIANGLDNASDGIVYIITLLALNRPPVWKRAAARVSGVLLFLFAVGILFDAGRRFHGDPEPLGYPMMVMAVVAATVNALCVWLLWKIQDAEVNVRAATTFSTNDFMANAGVLVGGGLVLWTGQAWPDLVVGLAVAAIALKGAISILQDANSEAGRS
jgi:cation diffusion facilitator family transporter